MRNGRRTEDFHRFPLFFLGSCYVLESAKILEPCALALFAMSRERLRCRGLCLPGIERCQPLGKALDSIGKNSNRNIGKMNMFKHV